MASSKLRILCFGDSLTAGYSSFGAVYHPYKGKLLDILQDNFPDLDIEADVDGQSGDITGFFMSRLVENFGPDRPRYDWLIILGGTNDLAHNLSAESIFENLSRCWGVALSHRVKVLALTVPEAGVKGGDGIQRVTERRDTLNTLIKNAQGGHIFVHDHHAAVPYWDMSEDDRRLNWDDRIHLTPAGYELMGEKIAERLIDVLDEAKTASAKPGGSQPVKSPGEGTSAAAVASSRPTRRKVFRDDNLVFDEETGDSSNLGQGYVVVRKKDLD